MRKKDSFSSILLGFKISIFIPIIVLFLTHKASGQVNVWSEIDAPSLQAKLPGDIPPTSFRAFSLNKMSFENFIRSIPMEEQVDVKNSQIIFLLPMPDGSLQQFRVVESPVMEKALAIKYPEIKTYLGKGIDDPTAVVRFDWTPLGFHALVIKTGGFVFIEPYNRTNTEQYISYYQKDLPVPSDLKLCASLGDENFGAQIKNTIPDVASGAQLRTYRLAVSATGEYTAQYGGNVANALAAMTTVVNKVSLIYEVEVAVRFVLIANNNLIIYTDATTDPFTNTAGSPCSTPIRSENQVSIDAVIGAANYDIGHVFTGTNIGGCASFAVVCGGNKAWGASGVRLGSAFDIGLTAHEMGHQFSAGHTFNSDIGSCLGGQYSASTAYEPGSGTTIMSYAGTCHDIQGFRDMLFHTISYDQIVSFSVSGGGNACPVTTNTGNTPPTVNAGPGGFVIPINTPFMLTGSGNDADGDPLTYSWEQFDLGPQGNPNTPAGNAPIFRSFPPVNNPSRTFPQLSDILNNTQTLGEIMPSYGRNLTFRLTARDNRLNGGGVEYASMSMSVDGAKGPFEVTSPNSSVTWCPGPQTVTWSVNGSDALAANVKISLSYDGGLTFPVTLSASTPNDGTESVDIPCAYNTTARIKVEAVGNVFFDISNANFTVGDNTDPTFTDPADITIYKDNNCNHDASVAVTGDVTDENDNCDNSLNATFVDAVVPGSCLGNEIITRTWSLTDDCGNTTTKNQVITVQDTTRPVISGISANPAVLWPPNHKMRLVTISYNVQDNCSPAASITSSLSVVSNEPINGTGDGDTAPDWVVVDKNKVWLRAERAGYGSGRIYTVTITSTDDCGNVTTGNVTVSVPHNGPVTLNTLGNTNSDNFEGLSIKALPNPSSNNFTILVKSDNTKDRLLVKVFDIYGRKIEDRNITSVARLTIGDHYRSGVYIFRVAQGDRIKELKLIKISE